MMSIGKYEDGHVEIPDNSGFGHILQIISNFEIIDINELSFPRLLTVADVN